MTDVARYRIIDPKGAYMPRSPELRVLQLGTEYADAEVMAIRAPIFEHLPQGFEIEYAGVPGPHLEPLNDAAREAMAAYRRNSPGATLDPTRHFPGGQDPMGGPSIEQSVGRLLANMEREASDRAVARPAPAVVGASADIAALVESQKATQEAVVSLAATMALLAGHLTAVPAPRGRAT